MASTIRMAAIDDYVAISRLATQLQELHVEGNPIIFHSTDAPILSEAKVGEIIADSKRQMIVAEMDGAIVGFVYGWIKDDPANEIERAQHFLIVEMVSIDEAYQGRGIGQALMHHLHEWGAAQGATHAQLYVWAFNGRAQEFYEAQGYQTMLISMARALR